MCCYPLWPYWRSHSWSSIGECSAVRYWCPSASRTSRVPLGLVLLGLAVVLIAVFFGLLLSVQFRLLATHRRHSAELRAQRELVDNAEASRFTELRQYLNQELAALAATQQLSEQHLREEIAGYEQYLVRLHWRDSRAPRAAMAHAAGGARLKGASGRACLRAPHLSQLTYRGPDDGVPADRVLSPFMARSELSLVGSYSDFERQRMRARSRERL